jgi:predicted protein tyrosine phosphatase
MGSRRKITLAKIVRTGSLVTKPRLRRTETGIQADQVALRPTAGCREGSRSPESRGMPLSDTKKLLFICGQNRSRSFTAEKLYEGFPGYSVKSAGVEPEARVVADKGHIEWADMIFVMERDHARRLRENFGAALEGKTVICLGIPDVYRPMSPDLIETLKASLSAYVQVPL